MTTQYAYGYAHLLAVRFRKSSEHDQKIAETESSTMYLCFGRCYSHDTFRHELRNDRRTACYIHNVHIQSVVQRP
jgi:hypothetical protein